MAWIPKEKMVRTSGSLVLFFISLDHTAIAPVADIERCLSSVVNTTFGNKLSCCMATIEFMASTGHHIFKQESGSSG